MQQQINIPSFALYQIGNDNSKMCYESSTETIICGINGPYFDRRKISLQPIFNIVINSSSNSNQPQKAEIILKLKQIMKRVIVQDRYMRMSFDIVFEVVEDHGKSEHIITSLINLLSFTCLMTGIQIKSIFSCASVRMKDNKICWKQIENEEHQRMTMSIESIKKEIVYAKFEGQYSFLSYQKISNILLDANEEFQKYIYQKVAEIHEKYV